MSDEQLTILFNLQIPYVERFWVKVHICEHGSLCRDCCWMWTGARTKQGYGNFWYEKKYQYAHRLSYSFIRGPIPDGLQLDHLCRVHACINPWHLEPVTQRINTLRSDAPIAQRARSDYCKNGHFFDEENTFYDYYYDKKHDKQRVTRRCRICINKKARDEYRRNDGWARKQRRIRAKASE